MSSPRKDGVCRGEEERGGREGAPIKGWLQGSDGGSQGRRVFWKGGSGTMRIEGASLDLATPRPLLTRRESSGGGLRASRRKGQ